MNTLFILGCGFLGTRVAKLGLARGQRVVGTLRDPAPAEALRALGVELAVAPTVDPAWLSQRLEQDAHVLVTYPPDPTSDAALSTVCAERSARVVYISSTAVYGATRGRIDHLTPAAPNEARGQRRLEAEDAWQCATTMVLRAPAIYGPGRGLHLRVARGEHQMPEGGDNFISRIHVDDLARLCSAAFERGTATTRYVVGDHRPCPQREITQWLCERLKQPMPDPTPMANVSPTLRNDRQIDPTWALTQLGVELVFPTYLEGYESCLQQDGLLSR